MPLDKDDFYIFVYYFKFSVYFGNLGLRLTVKHRKEEQKCSQNNGGTGQNPHEKRQSFYPDSVQGLDGFYGCLKLLFEGIGNICFHTLDNSCNFFINIFLVVHIILQKYF